MFFVRIATKRGYSRRVLQRSECVRYTATKILISGAMLLSATTGCSPVDFTQVRVRDPRAVGVVADRSNTWLLPPQSTKPVELYRGVGGHDSLSRMPSGAIRYTSEHWALGTRVDITPLTTENGGTGWASTPAASTRFADAVHRGGEVRLRYVDFIKETGPWGMCNGTAFDSCLGYPALPISLATDSRNIEEVRVTRTPIRGLGIGEMILGTVSVTFGAIDGAVTLSSPSSEARNIALGVGAGLVLLGGLLIGNGAWRVTTPDQEFTYQP
jgi:hypothetical protein